MEKLKCKNKKIIEKTKLVKYLKGLKPEVLLTLGAGDIDQLVKPVRRAFEK